MKNTNSFDGSPPFALADQSGRIQRLVEPVPGIDLEPFIGEVVVVRHDTGRTILATQLELPPRPLLPMVGDARLAKNADDGAQPFYGSANASGPARTVQFLDDDDTTTQIVFDDEGSTPDARPAAATNGQALASPGATLDQPTLSDGMAPVTLSLDSPFQDDPLGAHPMGSDPLAMESWPGGYEIDGMEACPECGGYHGQPGCRPDLRDGTGNGPSSRQAGLRPCRFYADAEINFLRAHVMEGAVGKLSEKYEFSPRFTVGFDGGGLVDGRVRYWIYDRSVDILSGGDVHIEFNVLDVEATHLFQAGRSEILVAGGLRLASVELVDQDGEAVGNDLLGMTMAADAYTPLCAFQGGKIAWVYGGRLSILGGDWGGDANNDFVPAPLQDDNVVADEIYVGVQFATSYREFDVIARLAFEMQNWHSDVLAQNAGTDSIGFIGPGVHLGAAF